MMFGVSLILGLVLSGAILLGLLWAVASYNGLVAARNEVSEAFGLVLARMRQRNELLPSLVETARGHMRHERDALERVSAAAREATALIDSLDFQKVQEPGFQGLQQAEVGVQNALGRLKALSAAYPELRASPTQARVSGELGAAENEISASKQVYGERVNRYNGLRATLPRMLLASLFGFGDAPDFEPPKDPVAEPPPQTQRLGSLKA
jgi:LemA protein